MLPLARSVLATLAAVAAAVTLGACNFGFVQGPDHPEDPQVLGPLPPADFHCERGERRRESTPGQTDRYVHVLGTGEVICSTEDANNDGKIDTWNRIEQGLVVEQAVDSDYDGTLDRRIKPPAGFAKPFAAKPMFVKPLPMMTDGGAGR